MADRAEGDALRPGTLVAVAVGGAAGACARYGLTLTGGTQRGEGTGGAQAGFPHDVLLVNVLGCALIGVLMVLLTERGGPVRPWLRPLLGVGLLGGFTSFSAYAADTVGLLERAAYLTALGYGLGTVLGALAAVWWGTSLTRWVLRGRRAPGSAPSRREAR